MKKHLKTSMLVLSGLLLSIPFWFITNNVMIASSTPGFCSGCHEIQPAFFEWKTSSHASNSKGVVVTCMDCHLPPPEQSLNFFFKKSYHGIKDLTGHFLGKAYNRPENRRHAADAIDNSHCLSCHKNILYLPKKRGAMLAHKSVLFPRPGYEKKCTGCHENLVHNPLPLYAYEKKEL